MREFHIIESLMLNHKELQKHIGYRTRCFCCFPIDLLYVTPTFPVP